MIWLTWRQSRGGVLTMAALLAALAVILGVTGPSLAHDYSAGLAACGSGGDCSAFLDQFFDDNFAPFLAVTAVMLVLPALIGVFWGAPLISRELEAGTHRLVWNQSITRTRWLAVKLGLTGLAAMTAAGLGSLAVSWWASPIDSAADFPRMEPLSFAARGIVPVGYTVFAFALGVTVGMLVRHTLPAMAITLAVFVAVQIAVPLMVRPHLLSPTRSTIEITPSNVTGFVTGPDGLEASAKAAPDDGWVLSSHIVDPSGHAVDSISLPSHSGPCAPSSTAPGEEVTGPENDPQVAACLTELRRLGYRVQATYHSSSRFWPFQWYETGIYTALALGLAGFSAWWIRRRLF
jgi:ABC-type transport system involved in multi-copper enzyme maturation permease subunit